MAVTGTRQATSITARLVTVQRPVTAPLVDFSRRCELLATGRLLAVSEAVRIARFADVAVVQVPDQVIDNTTKPEINGAFTKAFQPMVKHRDVPPTNIAGCPDGNGPGNEIK